MLAAWADVSNITDAAADIPPASAAMGIGLDLVSTVMQRLHIGYLWMLLNCLASAAYASFFSALPCGNADDASLTGSADAETYQNHRIHRLGFDVLQQFTVDPCTGRVFYHLRRLASSESHP